MENRAMLTWHRTTLWTCSNPPVDHSAPPFAIPFFNFLLNRSFSTVDLYFFSLFYLSLPPSLSHCFPKSGESFSRKCLYSSTILFLSLFVCWGTQINDIGAKTSFFYSVSAEKSLDDNIHWQSIDSSKSSLSHAQRPLSFTSLSGRRKNDNSASVSLYFLFPTKAITTTADRKALGATLLSAHSPGGILLLLSSNFSLLRRVSVPCDVIIHRRWLSGPKQECHLFSLPLFHFFALTFSLYSLVTILYLCFVCTSPRFSHSPTLLSLSSSFSFSSYASLLALRITYFNYLFIIITFVRMIIIYLQIVYSPPLIYIYALWITVAVKFYACKYPSQSVTDLSFQQHHFLIKKTRTHTHFSL